MKQDVIIRWLMENVDATQLARADADGSTIMYFAGVAQRFPNSETTATTTRRTTNRPGPVVAEDRNEQTAHRQPATTATRQPAPVVDLNPNETETITAPITPARQPARRPARQATTNGQDRVHVGGY